MCHRHPSKIFPFIDTLIPRGRYYISWILRIHPSVKSTSQSLSGHSQDIVVIACAYADLVRTVHFVILDDLLALLVLHAVFLFNGSLKKCCHIVNGYVRNHECSIISSIKKKKKGTKA